METGLDLISRSDSVEARVLDLDQQEHAGNKKNGDGQDGQTISAGDTLFTIEGPAATLLTGERRALNFLQLLSSTATTCRRYADLVADTGVRLLDTRKTIPGLRDA